MRLECKLGSLKLQGKSLLKKGEEKGKGKEKGKEMKRRIRKEMRGWDVFSLNNFVNLMYSTEPKDSVTDIVKGVMNCL